MGDIFTDHQLYPYDVKIKEHFRCSYDAVFIAFSPFFKMDKDYADDTNFKKSKQVSYEEAQQIDEIFQKIPPPNADIFIYTNAAYPTDREILERGKAIEWDTVARHATLQSYAEVNKALRTSIGALREGFKRVDLITKLETYTNKAQIWHPQEGCFNAFPKRAIYQAFKLLDKKQIVVIDEFYEKKFTLDLDTLTDVEFCEQINDKDYYVYSVDREILFVIEWDSFFFLIATDVAKMKIIGREKLFEGFLCDEQTVHAWDYTEKEM